MSRAPHQTIVVQQASTSGLAIAGLVFSILGWFTCGTLCILGAALSFFALFARGPKGTAVAGLVVGFPGVLFFLFFGLAFMLGLLGLGAAATSVADSDQRVQTPTDVVRATPSDETSQTSGQPAETTEDSLAPLDAEHPSGNADESSSSNTTVDTEPEKPVAVPPKPTEPEKPSPPAMIRPRRFTSANGKYSVMAKFVQTKDGFVQLRKPDNTLIPAKIAELTEEDQQYIQQAEKAVAEHSTAMEEYEAALAQYERDLTAYEEALRARDEQRRRQEAERQRREEEALARREVTRDGFSKVESGMTFDEVVKLLGRNYEELSRVDLPGAPTTVMFMWKQRSGIGNCNVTFQGGRVVSKAQFGLR